MLFSSKQIPGQIVDVLVVRRNILKTPKESLKNLIADYFTVRDQLHDLKPTLYKELSEFTQLTSEELTQAFGGIHVLDLAENITLMSNAPPLLQEKYLEMKNFLVAHNFIRAKNSQMIRIDDSYLRIEL